MTHDIAYTLLSLQVSAMTHLASNWLNAGLESTRWGTAHASIVPYQTFPSKDGYITIGCGNNKQFAELCKNIGVSELAEREEYKNNEDRVRNREQLIPVLATVLAKKTNAEWCEIFKNVSFPYGPVNKMSEVFEDPQVLHNGLKQSIEHPTIGQISTVGPAVKYSVAENIIRSPPPTLGQHSEKVLQDILGYTEQQIQELRDNKVLG